MDKDIEQMLDKFADKTCVERYVGNVDVERTDGTMLCNVPMYRKELLADGDDLDSVYEREYVAIREDDIDEELFLGNSGGQNLIIKERTEYGD